MGGTKAGQDLAPRLFKAKRSCPTLIESHLTLLPPFRVQRNVRISPFRRAIMHVLGVVVCMYQGCARLKFSG